MFSTCKRHGIQNVAEFSRKVPSQSFCSEIRTQDRSYNFWKTGEAFDTKQLKPKAKP